MPVIVVVMNFAQFSNYTRESSRCFALTCGGIGEWMRGIGQWMRAQDDVLGVTI